MPAAVRRGLYGLVGGVIAVWQARDVKGLVDDHVPYAVVALLLSVAVAVAIGPLKELFPRPGSMSVLLGAWVAVEYACVPETDQVSGLMPLLAIVVFVELGLHEPLGHVWHIIVADVVLWSVLYGATGRESAYVAGLFGAWTLLLPALVAVVAPLRRTHELVRWTVAGIAAVSAAAAARRGGLGESVGPAFRACFAAAIGSAVLAVIVTFVSARLARPTRR